jgi:hypothetical protein
MTVNEKIHGSKYQRDRRSSRISCLSYNAAGRGSKRNKSVGFIEGFNHTTSNGYGMECH